MILLICSVMLGLLTSSLYLTGEISDLQYRYIQLSLQDHEFLMWTIRKHCYAHVSNNKITRLAYWWDIVPKINELKREKAKDALVTDMAKWEERKN